MSDRIAVKTAGRSASPDAGNGAGAGRLAEIRKAFISWFEARDHTVLASAPLAPQDDPSLLFVNAGMVPFKSVFTGLTPPPAPRAVTVQKCVRAGGKHNDLDNVGYTARHHTFFEMLGNFSFGDYFKEEAIALAWGLVSEGFALPPERLIVTVYEDDEQARILWRKISGLSEHRILGIGAADNFWSMGSSGPCGPCSEIFYDHGEHVAGGPPGSPGADGDRFVEIWNLVFMQFDRTGQGRVPLPRPSIDTGMGLERMAAVMEGVHDNYEIALFRRLIAAGAEAYGVSLPKADKEARASLRVLADHVRACAFLIADGVGPANEGRGYVLRRIMRRAMRHGHRLGAREPVMSCLVAPLIEEMGPAWPELVRAQSATVSVMVQEEERFLDALGRGLGVLEAAVTRLGAGGSLPGEVAFRLYDTYGFPLDLTEDILRARHISVDRKGFELAMSAQRERARASWKGSADTGMVVDWAALAETIPGTRFLGYEQDEASAPLLLAMTEDGPVEGLQEGQRAELVFAQTPFYAESGGQAADQGLVHFASGGVFEVRDVHKQIGDVFAHRGVMRSGQVRIDEEGRLQIDKARRTAIRASHSATHLLHAALRNTLGTHVTQKGSLVEDGRLRFDFSHTAPLTEAQWTAIETEVNAVIAGNAATDTAHMDADAAVAAGALALFGEKYGESVRVLRIGRSLETQTPYSVELCGGTHVERTGDIGLFVITGETGVAAGVRRIEAATGLSALSYLRGKAVLADRLAQTLKTSLDMVPERVKALLGERRKLERELAEVKKTIALNGTSGGTGQGPVIEEIAGHRLLVLSMEGVSARDLRGGIDQARERLGDGVIVCSTVNEGKAALAVGVAGAAKEHFDAVALVRLAARQVGGKGGGGRSDMAQAGGPDGARIEAAIEAVRAELAQGLSD